MNIIFNKIVLVIAGLAIVGTLLYNTALKPKPKSIPPEPTENRAHFSAGTILSFSPKKLKIAPDQTQKIEIRANFAKGSDQEKLTYFKAEMQFPKENLEITNLDISPSGLNFLKGPVNLSEANSTGKLLIRIGALTDNDPRPSTANQMTIATLTLKAKIQSSSLNLKFNPESTEVVNNLRPDPKNIAVTRFEQAIIEVK